MKSRSSTEKTPLLSHSQTSPAQHGNWKSSLVRWPPSSMPTWTTNSKALIEELRVRPQHVPDEQELSDLFCDLMFHREVEALRTILSQEYLPILHIKSVYGQQHRDLSIALQTLLKAMPDQWPVKELTLTNQHLDKESCSLLFKVFEKMPALESLHLYALDVDNPRFGFGLPTCSQPLKLQILRLENTHSASPFLDRILEASPRLRVLYLDSNYGFTVNEHQSLAQALKRLTELRKLTLRQLRYDVNANLETVLRPYAEFVAHQTTLEHLDISGNPLTSDHCTALWNALQDKTNLTSLSLANCWQCDDKAHSLAQLVHLKSLVSLDLSNNQFLASPPTSSTSVVLISLADHPRLERLNLNLSMEPSLVNDLAYMLANNKTLISLELPVMNNADYAPLVEAMQINHTLRSLSIRGIEDQCSLMTAEQRQQRHPNYLALMNCIARNQKQNDKN